MFKSILDGLDLAVGIIESGKIVYVNDKAAQLLGWGKEELIGKPFTDVVVPSYRSSVFEKYNDRMKKDKKRYDIEVLTKEGEKRKINIETKLLDEEKPLILVVGRESLEEERLKNELFLRNRISAVLTESFLLEDALQAVLSVYMEYLSATAGLIRLYDERDKKLKTAVSKNVEKFPHFTRDTKPGEGISGYCFQSGETLLVDVSKTEIGKDINNIRYILTLPIISREKSLGVIQIFTLNEVSRDDVILLKNTLRNVGISIENLALFEKMKNRMGQRAKLYELTKELQKSIQLDDLLSMIVSTLEKMFSAMIVILLYDPVDERLRIRYASKEFIEVVKIKELKLGEGITGDAALSRKTIVVQDVGKDERYIPGHPDVHSELAIPLIVEDELIGVVDIESKNRNAFAEEDIQLVSIFAQQIAMAVKNAQLFERIRKENEAKSKLFAFLSHEIKNPLSIIRSSLWYLKNENISQGEVQEHVESMEEEMKNIEKTVDGFLELAKLQVAHSDVDMVWVDIETLLRRIVKSYERIAAEKNISLIFSSMLSSPLIMSHPERLRHIFSNLISNSIKYNVKGGRVSIKMDEKEEGVIIKIEDTGKGIPKNKLDKIFEPFYKTGDEEGTGIGLAVVREFVYALGGKIRIDSEEGKGTRFVIFLPRERRKEVV